MTRNFLYTVLFFSFLASAHINAQSSESKWSMTLFSGLNFNFAPKIQAPGPMTLRNNGSVLSHIGVGYDLTPAWEVRGQFGWANFRWPVATVTTSGAVSEIGLHATIDAMFNPVNALYGFDADRLFDFQLFAGAGGGLKLAYNHTTNVNTAFTPMLHVGVQANFHLSEQFSLNAEMGNYVIFDHTNPTTKTTTTSSSPATHFIDNLVFFSIGFTYHFGVPAFSAGRSNMD